MDWIFRITIGQTATAPHYSSVPNMPLLSPPNGNGRHDDHRNYDDPVVPSPFVHVDDRGAMARMCEGIAGSEEKRNDRSNHFGSLDNRLKNSRSMLTETHGFRPGGSASALRDYADGRGFVPRQFRFCSPDAIQVVDDDVAVEQRPQRAHSPRSFLCKASPSRGLRLSRQIPKAPSTEGGIHLQIAIDGLADDFRPGSLSRRANRVDASSCLPGSSMMVRIRSFGR